MNNTNIKKQVFLLFQNNRIEIHHPDNSILQWKSYEILYISPKGIKNTISLSQARKLPDLYTKFLQGLTKLNMYGIQNTYFCNETQINQIQADNGKDTIKMAMKINQFRWYNPQVQETKDGYEVKSDCSFAKVLLKKNLYIVEVSYLQYIGVKKSYATKIPNMTKILLQKYNYQYSQFPSLPQQQQKPDYFYVDVVKRFTIFNIPDQWKYPLHLIWSSLITYKVISHQFCYLDFTEQEMPKKTPMPKPKNIFDVLLQKQKGQNKDKQSDCTLPILGQINHRDECLFMKVNQCEAWYGENWNIMTDQIGFWFSEDLVSYRKVNRIEKQCEYHPRALPCVFRFKNQPERNILTQLKLFVTYKEENIKAVVIKKSENEKKKKNVIFDNENNLLNQEMIPEVGNFKAFSNGIVIVKFADRTMLTLNSKRMEVKIIRNTGDTSYVDLANTEGMSFQVNKIYITHAIDFQERTFFPEQWLAKQEYNKRVRDALQDSEALQKISSMYLKSLM